MFQVRGQGFCGTGVLDAFDRLEVLEATAEAVSRFRALAAKGLDGFVCPFGMPEPIPYMQTFAEQVIPQVVDGRGELLEELA